jgi:polyhydroxybutyrate depolymerase
MKQIMKQIMKPFLLLLFIITTVFGFTQQTINGSITHQSIQRTYILYVPASYSPGNSAPLVINFHGYTSSANDQMNYGDFRAIADTAGFLLVHPMGTLDSQGQTYWNANWGGTVDDIGFTEALIDSLDLTYDIDLSRVYSTGMSNGGFMSYTLACDLSNRIAAIASVTGTMNSNQSASCNPTHPMPVMEIHGTSDGTVPYTGSAGFQSITNVMSFWVGFNQCNSSPIVTNMPDINTGDGCTAEHSLYQSGNNGVEVEHYKIISGGHTWPGSSFVIGVTNYDINASEKIWQFFAKYDLNGKITTVNSIQNNRSSVSVFPNPANLIVNIQLNGIEINKNVNFILFDVCGKKVFEKIINQSKIQIDVSTYPKGTYTYRIENTKKEYTGKIIVQ